MTDSTLRVDLALNFVETLLDALMGMNVQRATGETRVIPGSDVGGYHAVAEAIKYPIRKRFDFPVALMPDGAMDDSRLYTQSGGDLLIPFPAMYLACPYQVATPMPNGNVVVRHVFPLGPQQVRSLVPRHYYDIHGTPLERLSVYEVHETCIEPDGREVYAPRWITHDMKRGRIGQLIGSRHEMQIFDNEDWNTKMVLHASILEDCFCQPHFQYAAKAATTQVYTGITQEVFDDLVSIRDNPTTVSGRRRPIRHVVSKHFRALQNGAKRVPVTAHFRGIEEFTVGEETVRVGLPVSAYNDITDDNLLEKHIKIDPDRVQPAARIELLRRLKRDIQQNPTAPVTGQHTEEARKPRKNNNRKNRPKNFGKNKRRKKK